MTDSPLFRYGVAAAFIAVLVLGALYVAAPILPDNSDSDSSAANTTNNTNTTDTVNDGTGVDPDRLEDAFGSTDNQLPDLSGNDGLDTFAPFAPIVVELEPQTVAPGDGVLTIVVDMPAGYKLNALAPLETRLSSDTDAVQVSAEWADYAEVTPTLPLEVPLTFNAGVSALTGEMTIYWCEAVREELCFIDTAEIVIPVVVDESADRNRMTATITLTPPEL